jgi:hypothetical protein
MPRACLGQLRDELLRSGIAPAHVQRTLTELDEHLDDLVEAALADGKDPAAAESTALKTLGDLLLVSEAMQQRPELKGWAWHYPRLARVVYPLACIAALPALPVLAGVQHASSIARWTACLLVGGFVTAFMFLVLQLSISPV